MGKTTIANALKKEVIFMAKNGHTYKFDFQPNISDVNNNPEKYEEYRVKKEEVATPADVPPPQENEDDVIEVNGVKYKKI